MLKKVIFVFKTHVDVGFTDLSRNVIRGYSEGMLNDIIDVCSKDYLIPYGNHYVWTMPAWLLHYLVFQADLTDDKRQKVDKLIRNGQLVWHALPFTTHTEFCGLEEYIRGLSYGIELSQHYGRKYISAKMTDVPGHTRMLPSILAKAGIKFLHLGSNEACVPPEVPPLFWWEGPDGSRVLTSYSDFYGTERIPPKDWKYPVWMALMQTNDNVGTLTVESISDMLIKTKQETGAECVIGTMDDFYNQLIQNQLDLPVIKQDIGDTWIHGVGTYPKEVTQLRGLRRKAALAEKLIFTVEQNNLWQTDGCREHIKEQIEMAYRTMLLFGEHTWGMDVKTCLGADRRYSKADFDRLKDTPRYMRIAQSWDEQRDRVSLAEKQLDDSLDCIMTNRPVLAGATLVYNPLSVQHEGWVKVSEENNSCAVYNCQTQQRLSVCRRYDGTYAYINNTEPMSFVQLKTEPISEVYAPKTEDAGILRVESARYLVSASADRGGIYSVYDKQLSKEWVDPCKGSFGLFEYEIFSKADIDRFIGLYMKEYRDWIIKDLGREAYPEDIKKQLFASRCTSVTPCGDGISLKLCYEMPPESFQIFGSARDITLIVSAFPNCDEIEFSYSLKNKTACLYIEAGNFVFPFKAENPEIRVNKMGELLNPAVDVADSANHLFYAIENFACLSDTDGGIAVASPDIPLLSIGKSGVLDFQRKFKQRAPTFYFNAFNTMWGTNFPQWLEGDYSFKFYIYPTDSGFAYKRALELLNPLFILDNCYLPDLSDVADGLETSSNVEILSVVSKQGSIIVRLHEINGQAGEMALKLPRGFDLVYCMDFYNNPTYTLEQVNGRAVGLTKPYELHTLRLQRSRPIHAQEEG